MLGGIKNNTLVQLVVWQLVGQLVGAVIGPYAQAITNQVNHATPVVPLSPADLAALVIRGELTEAAAADQARYSGVDGERFHQLVRLSGDAPGPMDLAVALRRGLIDKERYDRGIAEGRLRPEWGELVRELAVAEPPPTAMLGAYLEGQIGEAEARRRYRELGGDPAYFDILYNSQGSSPTPLEAAEMARRGVIPWDGTGPHVTSYEQAFLEGPWRNKWSEPFRSLAEYLPPPRTVTAMYREGSIGRDRAAELLRKGGLAEDLIAAYLASGSAGKTQASKDLAVSTVVKLYGDQLISRTDASDWLQGLGYAPDEADFILQVEDVRVTQRFLDLAVGRVRTLYVGHKLDKGQALAALARFQVESEQASTLVGIWDWERSANVKALTAAEIGAAQHLSLMTTADALAALVALGYTPRDAWLYLSIRNKGPLTDAPAPTDDQTAQP